MNHAIKLLTDFLNKFPTSYEEDLTLINSNLPLRKYFAILYRSQVKEILLNQIQYITSARNIINRAFECRFVDAIKTELTNSSNPEKIEYALHRYLTELKSS